MRDPLPDSATGAESAALDAPAAVYTPRYPGWRPRAQILGADARLLALVLGAVCDAISGGALSAQQGDTSHLTYADGWAAAATLAQLVSADALAGELTARQ